MFPEPLTLICVFEQTISVQFFNLEVPDNLVWKRVGANRATTQLAEATMKGCVLDVCCNGEIPLASSLQTDLSMIYFHNSFSDSPAEPRVGVAGLYNVFAIRQLNDRCAGCVLTRVVNKPDHIF